MAEAPEPKPERRQEPERTSERSDNRRDHRDDRRQGRDERVVGMGDHMPDFLTRSFKPKTEKEDS